VVFVAVSSHLLASVSRVNRIESTSAFAHNKLLAKVYVDFFSIFEEKMALKKEQVVLSTGDFIPSGLRYF